MESVCYVHGDWVPASEAKISLFDSGLMYGETITETLRTFRRKPYEVSRHLARFRDSCRIARIDVDSILRPSSPKWSSATPPLSIPKTNCF